MLTNRILRAIAATPALVFFALCLVAAGRANDSIYPKAGPIISTTRDWGTPWADLESLFAASTQILWQSTEPIPKITVYRSSPLPITLYQKANGRVQIGVTPHGPHWGQFVYQFSHEFCHTMIRFSPVSSQRAVKARESNLWFEETLCEVASLYVLRRIGEVWAADGDPVHARYAKEFAKYADDTMRPPGRRLSEGETFTHWFFDKQVILRRAPETRTYNAVVAKELLPLFEANPQGWEAVCYLNLAVDIRRKPFQDFLTDWQQKCPEDLRSFVGQVSAVFYP